MRKTGKVGGALRFGEVGYSLGNISMYKSGGTYGLSFSKEYTWIEKLKGKEGGWNLFISLGEFSWQPNHLKPPEM